MNRRWFNLVMGDDNRVAKPLIVVEEDFFGIDYVDLKHGRRIEQWNALSSLRSDGHDHDGAPDDILANSLGLPVFSAKLQGALCRSKCAAGDIQYLPVQVFQSSLEEVKGFVIANIIARVRALDCQKSVMLEQDDSEIDPMTGEPAVVSVWKAALRSSVLKEHDVVRLVEFFPPVFVSDSFVDVFNAGNFTGATFLPVTVC